MFRVENADFIADKLASELLPNQEFREVVKNSLEAVERRLANEGVSSGARIELDVDWQMLALTGGTGWYLSCADNGDGMNRSDLARYTTTLAVTGAGQNQSMHGNQGMGLKISGPTRHKVGLLIRSLKDGGRTAVQIGWSGHEYGLLPLGDNGELVVPVGEDSFPKFINEQGSGTVVTFLGNAQPDNTFVPPDGRPRGWLLKYLNQRFFQLSQAGVKVLVRVPSGDVEDWPQTPDEAAQRQRKVGKSFNMTVVNGTATVWDDAADRLGDDYRGTVDLAGDPSMSVPPARLHWWVLPSGPGTDVSTRTASGGSIAVLYQNELHDWRVSSQANPFFARLGVLFGKNRIAFVLEPLGVTVTSDFARAHVLMGGRPVFETDGWLIWSEQFRSQMPAAIQRTMTEEQARLQAEDPDRARRIRERLKDVMALLRPRRFKKTPGGNQNAGGPAASGADGGAGRASGRLVGSGRRQGSGSPKGIGSLLSSLDDLGGQPANEVFSILSLDPKWVTEDEAENFPIVNGNGKGLNDRAAALAGEDGVTASILLLNREFRGYQAIVAAVNEWANPDGDDDVASKIETFTQEWIEQKMVEAVNGLRQLENGTTWLSTHYDDALSPVALTAAFMADRYHTLREVKRQAGPLRGVQAI